jgi:hypothetical protein
VWQGIWTPAFSGVTEFLKLRELDRKSALAARQLFRQACSSHEIGRVSFVPSAVIRCFSGSTAGN